MGVATSHDRLSAAARDFIHFIHVSTKGIAP
jgi:hypothetical protein